MSIHLQLPADLLPILDLLDARHPRAASTVHQAATTDPARAARMLESVRAIHRDESPTRGEGAT